MSYFPRAARAVVVLLLVAAAMSLPMGSSSAASKHRTHRPVKGVIIFKKNWKNPYRSRIIWKAKAKTAGGWKVIDKDSWRAGSGFGKRARDECAKGAGWSPNGTYSFVQHNRRRANLINGRVFQLQSKACRNGTVRELMFIHSEQTWNNRQCPNKKGDDGCRWEVPRVNDYRSWGCIKMAPKDVADLTRHFHRYFRQGVRYPTSVVKVRVVGHRPRK